MKGGEKYIRELITAGTKKSNIRNLYGDIDS